MATVPQFPQQSTALKVSSEEIKKKMLLLSMFRTSIFKEPLGVDSLTAAPVKETEVPVSQLPSSLLPFR